MACGITYKENNLNKTVDIKYIKVSAREIG